MVFIIFPCKNGSIPTFLFGRKKKEKRKATTLSELCILSTKCITQSPLPKAPLLPPKKNRHQLHKNETNQWRVKVTALKARG